MNLEKLYESIDLKLKQIDFHSLWTGFHLYKFALYNDKECFFDGKYIEKTDAFCANTSIMYNGEYIAIWYITEEIDSDILASKLVHEMFHGYQMENGWNTFANEFEALINYRYSVENLSIKKKENELLLLYLENGDRSLLEEVLSLKKYRSQKFPYEYKYEACNEMIEGSATYIELKALACIHGEKYEKKYHALKKTVLDSRKYIPIRILCYDSGALLFMANGDTGIDTEVPLGQRMIETVPPKEIDYKDEEINTIHHNYLQETRRLIDATLEKNEIVSEEAAELIAFNVYNARYHEGFIVSTYFCQVRSSGEDKIFYGDFLIQIKDDFAVEKIYRLCK